MIENFLYPSLSMARWMALYQSEGGPEMGSSVDSTNTTDEGNNSVSQADVQRVRENEGQAKKAAGQKAQHRKNNNALASFFVVIFTQLPDDIVSLVYQTFFTKRNKTTGAMECEGTMHMVLLAAICTPFFLEDARVHGLYKTFNDVSSPVVDNRWDLYLQYVQAMLSFTNLQVMTPSIVGLIYELGLHAGLHSQDQISSESILSRLTQQSLAHFS